MTTHRERLTAPPSWWIAALAFAVVWGWLFLVVTTWPIAIVVTVLVAIADLFAVWSYGSLLITAGPDGLRVGKAQVGPAHIGSATALNRVDYRTKLGVGADARAYLVTRPYLDHGVAITINDPADPAPYWLVSSRHAEKLAAALHDTHDAPTEPAHDTIGDSPRGKKA